MKYCGSNTANTSDVDSEDDVVSLIGTGNMFLPIDILSTHAGSLTGRWHHLAGKIAPQLFRSPTARLAATKPTMSVRVACHNRAVQLEC
jgi:hypothetical protein